MRNIAVFFITASLMMAAALPVCAEPSPFKSFNPDIDKFAFARDLIFSISYYKRVSDRFKAEESVRSQADSDIKVVRLYIEDRVKDNTEIRIARNYLTRYTTSKNGLIQKVARQAVGAYDAILALSSRERDLWQAFGKFKTTGKPEDFDESAFTAQQLSLVDRKKEMAKELLTSGALLQVVLLSNQLCDNEDCKYLALTQKERTKLVRYLDEFAADNLQWGIKEGQTTLDAMVASIREVLEDSLYISREK